MTLLKKLALLVFWFTVSVFADDMCMSAYQAGDYQRAEDCFIGQLKKDKTVPNFLGAGISLERQGRYKEALSYLKEAEKQATGQGDLGTIYNRLSMVYSGIGDKKSELAYDMKYLDIVLKTDNQSEIGKAYSNLGVYYTNNGDDNKALEFYTKSLDYIEENKRATTYENIAVTSINLHDTAKAEEYHQKAIDIEVNSGDYLGLCNSKTNLGVFYEKQNRFDKALSILNDAKDICHKAGDISREAHALGDIAYLYYKKGDTAIAKQYINQAIPLAKQSGSTGVLGEVAHEYKIIIGQIKE